MKKQHKPKTKQELLDILHETEVYLASEHNTYDESSLLLYDFDNNYYGEGSIMIGNTEHTIESVWTGKRINDDVALMLHISDKEFEGDIEFCSISHDNQKRVIDMLRKHIEQMA